MAVCGHQLAFSVMVARSAGADHIADKRTGDPRTCGLANDGHGYDDPGTNNLAEVLTRCDQELRAKRCGRLSSEQRKMLGGAKND